MPAAAPRVSILVPTYNAVALTRRCIESLRRTVPVGDVELIICDDASTDGTAELVDTIEWATVMHNPDNRGFAGTCNRLAAAASAPVLVFCNDDVEATESGWLETLLGPMQDQTVGICGARLLYPDGTIQHDGVEIGEHEGLLHTRHRRHGLADTGPAEVDFPAAVTAALMAIRSDLFHSLGGFDTGFVNGNEDIDLCFRAADAGWRVAHVPGTTLVHHESQSPGRFDHLSDNIVRLHSRWHGHVTPHFIGKGAAFRTHPAVLPVTVGVIAAPGTQAGVHAVLSTIDSEDPVVLATRDPVAVGAAGVEGINVSVLPSGGFGAMVAAILDVAAEGPLVLVDSTVVVHDGWLEHLGALGEADAGVIEIAVDDQLPLAESEGLLLVGVPGPERSAAARDIVCSLGLHAASTATAQLATCRLPSPVVSALRDNVEILRELRTRAGVAALVEATAPAGIHWLLDTAALSMGTGPDSSPPATSDADIAVDTAILIEAGMAVPTSLALLRVPVTLLIPSENVEDIQAAVLAYARAFPGPGHRTLLIVETRLDPGLVEGTLLDALDAAGFDPVAIPDVEVGRPDVATPTGPGIVVQLVAGPGVPLTAEGLQVAVRIAAAERHSSKATAATGR